MVKRNIIYCKLHDPIDGCRYSHAQWQILAEDSGKGDLRDQLCAMSSVAGTDFNMHLRMLRLGKYSEDKQMYFAGDCAYSFSAEGL